VELQFGLVMGGMRKLTILLLSFFVSLPLMAGWTRAGLYGADSRALAISPTDPDLLFLGASQGDVYVSTDGGATWKNPRASTPFPGYVVDNLAIDEDGRLWAAAWGLWGGSVIAVSTDNGRTWERRDQGLRDRSIRAFAVAPSRADTIVAGGLDGVWMSENGGATWRKISEQVNVESLAIDPRSTNTIYVGTWRQAWRTDDGGRSWKHIAKGMVLDTDVFAINIDLENPDDVWLSTCGWVYNSADRGDTWVRQKEGFDNRRIHVVERDPRDSKVLYAGSVAGLYRSTDGGVKWSLISPDTFVITGIATHEERPDRIVLSTEGDGVYASRDGGATWARSSDGLYNVRVANVTPDPAVEQRIFATVFFGGASSGVYVSEDGGATWAKLNKTPLPEVLSFLARKEGTPRFVAGTENGFWFSDDGSEWERADPLITPVRVHEILELNQQRLFAATALGVFTSRDGGRRWYRLGLDETTADIALGRFGSGPALYALTGTGLKVYDGTKWSDIEGAPTRGTTIAVRQEGRDRNLVIVAGSRGVEAGLVDDLGRWVVASAPKGEYGSVYAANASGLLFVTFNDRHEIHLYDGGRAARWKTIGIPTTLRDVAGVAADPFRDKRFYVGTHGQGILIWDESAPRTAAADAAPAYRSGGASK
jgi:photosystem II stability/assembly factor-like uncharacterized protein